MRRQFVAAASALVLAGCASFSPDGGMDTVSALTQARSGQPVALQRSRGDADSARARTTELLRQALTAETAVELALLNNRGLQASLSELGVAEADLVQAGRLRNPVLSLGRMALGGGAVEIERSIVFDVLGLLTLREETEVQRQGFEQAQLRAAAAAVRLAAEARKAFYAAVAAEEMVRYQGQVQEAAEVSNELTRRMRAAGNTHRLAQLREQAFYADATAGLARAQHQALVERERLIRLLGVSDAAGELRLPDRLPELPDVPWAPDDLERSALANRLDVLMAERAADATARSLGLTNATRGVEGVSLGYQNRSETGEPRRNGGSLEVEFSVFDFGAARSARAEALHRQAVHRAAQVALDARSEVRESHSAYRTAHELARHYRDEVLPLRKRIAEENLLRYNGMLIGVFELLADSREQVRSVTEAVQALRDFWIAQSNLQTALTAGSPGAGPSAFPAAAASAEPGRTH